MQKLSRKSAFTLIELLVVVAIIALLLSILLPSLSGAREQGKRAKCLAGLSNIGKAVYQYANEDRAEQVIPIQLNMMRAVSWWEARTANWFAWGGRSGQQLFKTSDSAGIWLSEDQNVPQGGIARPTYASRWRPLNVYMLADVGSGDDKKMEWFECPGDKGYPDSLFIDDSPKYNAERRCYDTLGNSYRGSLASYLAGQGSGGYFAYGPWGHRLSSLQDMGRLVLMGEPSWFNMIGQDEGTVPEVVVSGWHGRKMVDNLMYCDGSARSTKAEPKSDFNETEWGVDPQSKGCIHRGSTFRLDVYPVGGAIIWGDWSGYMGDGSLWPWKGFQQNLSGQIEW